MLPFINSKMDTKRFIRMDVFKDADDQSGIFSSGDQSDRRQQPVIHRRKAALSALCQ